VLEKFPRHAFCGFVYLVKYRLLYPTPSGGDINININININIIIKQVTLGRQAAMSIFSPTIPITSSTYTEYPAKSPKQMNKHDFQGWRK
jgi:hypothetical protein